jgi:hypothetical protein
MRTANGGATIGRKRVRATLDGFEPYTQMRSNARYLLGIALATIREHVLARQVAQVRFWAS